jgi:hypothetical protein
MPAHSNDDFFSALRALIDAWCDRRCLDPLSLVLRAYLGFNGLTDGWAELYESLRTVRANSHEQLTSAELETVNDLIRIAEKIVYRG